MIDNFVLLGLALDLVFTYKFLKIYKIKFPKKDYTVVEKNPLIRSLVRTFGLGEGMVYSGLIIFAIVVWLLRVIAYEWKYFLLGAYYMMIAFHLMNFLEIKRIKEVKK